MIIRCIAAKVYKHRGYDCSNGGLSSVHDEVLVPCEGGNVKVDTDSPPPNLCARRFVGNDFGHAILVPWKYAEGRCVVMFGGCYVCSSDSRWQTAVLNHGEPVRLHDRVEG